MFPMTVTIHNANQLSAIMAAMGAPAEIPTIGDPAPAEKLKKEAVEKKSTTAQKADAALTQPTAEAVAAAVPESKPEATSAPETVAASPAAYPDVVAAINKLALAKGRDAAIALLGDFGVTKGPELKPEQFAEFIEKATAATGE